MNDFSATFLDGFLCTAFLFIVCFLSVIGGKTVYLAIKRYLPQKPEPAVEPPKQETNPKPKRRKPRNKKPAAVRSIEIDPNEIDKIYVKKSS